MHEKSSILCVTQAFCAIYISLLNCQHKGNTSLSESHLQTWTYFSWHFLWNALQTRTCLK